MNKHNNKKDFYGRFSKSFPKSFPIERPGLSMTTVVAEEQSVLAQSHHLRCAGNSEGNGAKVGQGYQTPANKMGSNGKGQSTCPSSFHS